jgi:tetratricopeptide (TPR) repeat protein
VARGKAHHDDDAINDLTKAIALKADYADAYGYRCNVYARGNQLDKAIADCDNLVSLRPTFVAYNDRAWAYHRNGEDAKGLPDAEKAVTMAPTNATILETRAEIYERLGRRDGAIADYRAVLAVDSHIQLALDGLKRLGADP